MFVWLRLLLPLLMLIRSTRATLCVSPVPTISIRDSPIRLPMNETAPPVSCAAAEVRFGVLRVLVRGGFVVVVLCHLAKEYLVLPQQGADANFAAVQTRVTRFCAIRFDPATLLVDIGDLTFAESEGATFNWRQSVLPLTDVPFGLAADCRAGNTSSANINLAGTPFAIADSMQWVASNISSPSTRSEFRTGSNRQIADISSGGMCDTIAPGAAYSLVTSVDETPCNAYQWQLQLQIANPGNQTAVAPCDVPPRNQTGKYTCRDRTLPSPRQCATLATPAPAPFAGRNNLTVHACPPLPPPDMRTTPYPSNVLAYTSCTSCIAAGIIDINGQA
jgi:hypothetical protein